MQFESGEISRVLVSSPWMPPVCSFCKEVGHSIKRCKTAPIYCLSCKSVSHPTESCPRGKASPSKKKKVSPKQSSVAADAPKTSILATIEVLPASIKGKQKEDISVPPPGNVGGLQLLAKEKITTAPTSEWIQVKHRKPRPYSAASSSRNSTSTISIDIGLGSEDKRSLATDSSNAISSEDGIDVQSFQRCSHRDNIIVLGARAPNHPDQCNNTDDHPETTYMF